MTVYVSIGNSDDKLTQSEWARFVHDVMHECRYAAKGNVHGQWHSLPNDTYQNACICFEIEPAAVAELKARLNSLRKANGQDSIAWAEATTEFIQEVAR